MGTDGNEDGISKDGEEVNGRKKPYTTCRRDQPFSFGTRHHLCRQGVALASTRQLRLQGPVSVNAHRTEGVTGCVGREETNGIMGGIKVGGGNGNGKGSGAGTGTLTLIGKGTEWERERGWRPMKERKMGTKPEDEKQDRGE